MERMTFVVFLCVCRVSLTGFMAPAAELSLGRAAAAALKPCPGDQQTRVEKILPEMMLHVICLQMSGLSLRSLASEGKGLTDRHPWVVSDGAVRLCVPVVPVFTVEPASAPTSQLSISAQAGDGARRGWNAGPWAPAARCCSCAAAQQSGFRRPKTYVGLL